MKFDYKEWVECMHNRLEAVAEAGTYRMIENYIAPPVGRTEMQSFLKGTKLCICSELATFYADAAAEVRERLECSESGPAYNGRLLSIGFQIKSYKSIKRLTTMTARDLFGVASMDRSGTLTAVLKHGYVISEWTRKEFVFAVSENDDIDSGIYFWTWSRGVTRCASSLVAWLKTIASMDYSPPTLQNIEEGFGRDLQWFQ